MGFPKSIGQFLIGLGFFHWEILLFLIEYLSYKSEAWILQNMLIHSHLIQSETFLLCSFLKLWATVCVWLVAGWLKTKIAKITDFYAWAVVSAGHKAAIVVIRCCNQFFIQLSHSNDSSRNSLWFSVFHKFYCWNMCYILLFQIHSRKSSQFPLSVFRN